MGWRTVIVNTHSKLSYQNNHLIFKTAVETESIHLSEIDILLLETTDITMTTMLVKRLMDENILVIFCDNKRLPIARLQQYSGRHDSSLQLAKQVKWDEDAKAQVWTSVIYQKIINQGNTLVKIGATAKAERIKDFAESLQLFDTTNREGHAARMYFQALFGKDFSRKVDNDINAALDYGYSLILSMLARELVACGCITQLGLKHSNQFNEFNLASDIMEPFRPLVDIIVYEHQEKGFKTMKRAVLSILDEQYSYGKSQMFVTNIISDYVKKIVKVLNCDSEAIPQFEI